MKKVSILIPVYNREKIINKTIQSALSQTYQNIEIIIVDNKSNDSTFEICKNYEKIDNRIKVYQNNKNIGPVENWKKCLEYSTGYYVKFLWSDDWLDDNFIEEHVNILENNENVGFTFSPAYIVQNDKKKISYDLFEKNVIFDSKDFIKYYFSKGKIPVSPGCALFRRKDVEKNLLVDIPNEDNLEFNRFGAGNDFLIFLLTTLTYDKIAFVNSTKAYFRYHEDSFSVSNNLSLYYDYAIYYFLQKLNDKTCYNFFKTMIFLKKVKHKEYNNLYSKINGKVSLSFLTKKINKKIISKIRGVFRWKN